MHDATLTTGAGFLLVERAIDHPDAVALIEQTQQYYVEVYGGRDSDPVDPAAFAPPRGLFLVGYLHGAPVASGGWRLRPDGSAEIKRMFVTPAARGGGLARRLLAELEARAAAARVVQVVLNTGFRQQPAIALYESSGYRPTDERYGHYAGQDGALFFVKSLER